MRIARVLLERCQDDLEELEHSTEGELRDRISGVFANVSIALETLPD
jgi:hypothetical protein